MVVVCTASRFGVRSRLPNCVQISNFRGAPHGTGGAGLFVVPSPEGVPMDELVDFFTIPLDKP